MSPPLAESKPHDLLSKLEEVSDRFNALLSECSVPTSVNKDNLRKLAETKSAEELGVFHDRLEFFLDVCVEARELPSEIEDKQILWSCIRRLGARPPGDLMDRIEAGDFIEIYDTNGIQVFRNFEFCRLITYTLDEILNYSWDELYQRSLDLNSKIHSAVERMFTQRMTITDLEIPTHTCMERKSGSGRAFEVTMKFFAPLYVGKDAVYLLAASRIERLA